MIVERYKFYTVLYFGAMWTMLCYGFVSDEIVPPLAKVRSFVALLCDAVFLILGLMTIRSRRDIFMLVSLLVISVISMYLNKQGLAEWLNGFRDYIGLLFIVPFIRYMMSRDDYARRFTRSMDKQLLIFLYLQTLCVTWQFLRYGAGDWGGGSMGYGHSGIVSTLIYAISFYFMTKGWDYGRSYIQNLYSNRIYVILLFPTFLNETKISFIYILAYFILLMKVDRRFILRLVMSVPLALIGFFLLGYVYINATGQDADQFSDESFFIEYLIGEDIEELTTLAILVEEEEIETDNLWAVDLPRIGRYMVLPEAVSTSGGGLGFGAGIGQFKGNDHFVKSNFSRKYAWLLRGSVTVAFGMVVELGLVGLIWIVLNLASIIMTPNKCQLSRNLKLYMALIFAICMVYQDPFRLVYFCTIVFYICLEGLQPQYKALEVES